MSNLCNRHWGVIARYFSPNGSEWLFPTPFSLPLVLVLVTGRPKREEGSPGLCDWLRVRLRVPFAIFAPFTTPLVRLGLDVTELLPGRRVDVAGGEDDGCWALSPLAPTWGKGGGGRFIFGGCEPGFETAVAILAGEAAPPE
jgi:hypothetical protein